MVSPEALAALHAVSFAHPRPWTAAEFAGLLGGAGVVLLTAEGGDAPRLDPAATEGGGRREAPRGFLLGRILAGEAEVLTLAVDPGARRAGLGADLVRRFLRAAAEGGAERVFLEVAEDNAAARALYAKSGFAEVGRRRNYAGPGIDALVLARGASKI